MTLEEPKLRTSNPLVGVEFELTVEAWEGYEDDFKRVRPLMETFGLTPVFSGEPGETRGRFKLLFSDGLLGERGPAGAPHYFWLQVFARKYYRDDGYGVVLCRPCFTDGRREYFPVLTSGGASEGHLTEEQLGQEAWLLQLVQVS